MISTKLHDGRSPSLYHRLTGTLGESDVRASLRAALDLIKAAVFEFDDLPLILDARGCRFENEAARRAWADDFYKNTFENARVTKIAVVGMDPAYLFPERDFAAAGRPVGSFATLEEARLWIAAST